MKDYPLPLKSLHFADIVPVSFHIHFDLNRIQSKDTFASYHDGTPVPAAMFYSFPEAEPHNFPPAASRTAFPPDTMLFPVIHYNYKM